MKKSYMLGIGIAAVLALTLGVAGIQAGMNSPSQAASGTSAGTSTPSVRDESSVASSSSGSQNLATTSTSSTGTGVASSASSTHQASSGDFALMATDPPIAASGVSSATVTYNGLAVHSAGSSSTTGWTDIDGTGTINLMSSVNASQTIASAQVQSGTYDMVAMNVTSGTVVYNGQTYAAAIASGNMQATLENNAQVNSTTSGAAIIDLRTFIVNTGNSSSTPQFAISASAVATAVPPSTITTASLQVGATSSLQGQAWWTAFEQQTTTNVTISSAALTAASLNVQLSSSGNASGQVQTVIVTPVSAGAKATATLPATLSGSAVFTVSNSDSVQQSNTMQGAILLNSAGTIVSAGTTASVEFTGTISLGFGSSGTLQVSGVVPGQTYLITVMGANTFANVVVVAQ